MQLISRPFDEVTTLRAGEAYQRHTDWHTDWHTPTPATPAHHVMGDGMPRTFSGDALEHALRTARLDLPRERLEIVRDAVESLYAVLDELDPLELGETPPATAFNARWE